MLRAALFGLVAFGVSSGYSWWLIYRAGIAVKRLEAHQGRCSLRWDLRDTYVVRLLPVRWRSGWQRFRMSDVHFHNATAEPIPVEAFEELRHLPFLNSVSLGNCAFNPDDLTHLSSARQIRELSLNSKGWRVSDDALDAILQLRNLRRLGLSESCITDDGVARLAALEQLTLLDLNRCYCVSQEAVDRLSAKLPNCKILYVPPRPYHRFTCPTCGHAINRGEWMNGLLRCPQCGSREALLMQTNFDICHPVIEHRVPARAAAK